MATATLRRGVKAASPCQIGNLLEVLTRPWTLHILWALSHDGPMRFGVLRRQVEGISSRVLTERLRTLEENAFVFRHYQAVIPPAVTYGITDRMKDIEKVLAQLEDRRGSGKHKGGRAPRPAAQVPHHSPESSYEAESRAGIVSENLRCCPQGRRQAVT